MQMKILRLFILIAFGLHYLFCVKVGCTSAMRMKILRLFILIAFGLHYLCHANNNALIWNKLSFKVSNSGTAS